MGNYCENYKKFYRYNEGKIKYIMNKKDSVDIKFNLPQSLFYSVKFLVKTNL